MDTRRLIAAGLCLAFLLTAGCGSKKNNDKPEESSTQSESAVKKDTSVKMKKYELPAFLEKQEKADVLSNVVYRSFDPAAIMVEPKEQPFEGYKCTAVFNDSVYVYVDGEHYGLLDGLGEKLLPADDISKITAVAAGMLRITRDDGTTEYYSVSGEKITSEQIADFDSSRISFYEVTSAGDEDSKETSAVYLLQLDGEQVYDTEWVSYEKLDPDSLDTQKSYEAVYRASAGSASYYITFDKFYNLTIYECEYGLLHLQLRGKEAECYILDQEHYKDLCTLIGSFGKENRSAKVSAETDDDYIQISLDAGAEDKKTVTISPDGFCFTEDAAGGKYFSVMDPETFTDLVSWIDGTLSTEYNS